MNKIKKYFLLRKEMQIEVLETPATICLFLEHEGRTQIRNPQTARMKLHFEKLKAFSAILKKELRK